MAKYLIIFLFVTLMILLSCVTVESCLCARKTNEMLQVCGTDGKTYKNRSHLGCAVYCGDTSKDTTVDYDGECRNRDNDPMVVTWSPY